MKKKLFRLSSFQIIILGFAGAILLGSLLLMLPFASKGNGSASFIDALFTSTSAVCVTGLIVHDTATYWSEFGQAVILVLIQIGGMGVVTAAGAITVLSGKKIGLMQRSIMQEATSAPQVGGIVKFTGFILKIMLFIEAVGFAAMLPIFWNEFGMQRGLWYSLFHSVSAFCNAGFDLMGIKEQYSSLTSYSANPALNIIVMFLIIAGGIGFFTWNDIKVNRHHFRKYKMQSKVILTTSAVLILLPALFFFFADFSGSNSMGERILNALFQAVSPRTAGFNSVDLNSMSDGSNVITIILMLIGGSPGSTAGGLKTTTIAVLFASAITVFRRKENAQFFGRRVSSETVSSSAAILLMYLTLFLSGGIAVSCIDNLSMKESLFETASAIGTAGLTLGVTPNLSTASHIILILLMYLGRVGGLTLIFAAVSGKNPNVSKLPLEKITVG